MMIDPSLHTRHGGELQPLQLAGVSCGVMTRYPQTDEEVADMLRAALDDVPCITNLSNPGEDGIAASYAANLPEKKPVYVHDLVVFKTSNRPQALGDNGFGRTIRHESATLQVFDPARPDKGWRPVRYNAFPHWRDRTTVPLATYERMWQRLYVPGVCNYGIFHCMGGVGRTPSLMFRLPYQHMLDTARAQGRRVSQAESDHFLASLIEEARRMRGNFVLPDEDQLTTLHMSCQLGLAEHHRQMDMLAMARQLGPSAMAGWPLRNRVAGW